MNTTATGTVQREKRAKHRMAGADLSMAEEVMKAAFLLLVPEDQLQRKAFEKLMPYLFVLRNKGCSWEQLTTLLNECGFKLQMSTVRNYYGDMQQAQMEVCQRTMTEQILLLNEVKKQTKGINISEIAGRAAGIMEKTRMSAGAKIDAMFGMVPIAPGESPSDQESSKTSKLAEQKPREPASPAPLKNPPASPADPKKHEPASPAPSKNREPASPAHVKTKAEHRSAPETAPDDDHGFGLLIETVPSKNSAKPTFFDLDDEPTIPTLSPEKVTVLSQESNTTTALHKKELRCGKLTQGIAPIKRRPNVPSEVYEEGKLEHPAVPGMMLSLTERLYGAALEFIDEDGVIMVETINEKRFRVLWQKPIPSTPTMTSKNFTDMDLTLFGKKP